jgi:hypothetical protein
MSLFGDGKGKSKESCSLYRIPEFSEMAREIVETLRTSLGQQEIRALAVDKVSSPALHVGTV